MKKLMISTLVLAMVVGIVGVADAAGRGAGQKQAEAASRGVGTDDNLARGAGVNRLPAPRVVGGPAALVPGTIQYDNGAVVGTLGVNSVCVGNQFDTAVTNPLTASGSVTAVSVYMVDVGGGAAFVSILDQLAGTVANVVTSFSTPMVPGFNNIVLGAPANYLGSTFLAGAWQFNTDLVGIGTGTTGGQGFHGMTINDISGTGFNRPGTYNGVVRASGNVIIPVELTGFEIVDE